MRTCVVCVYLQDNTNLKYLYLETIWFVYRKDILCTHEYICIWIFFSLKYVLDMYMYMDFFFFSLKCLGALFMSVHIDLLYFHSYCIIFHSFYLA